MLGVQADRVITVAVVLAGVLAAVVAVVLTVSQPLVTPTFALHETIIVLVGVVVGGIDRLGTATLGAFAIGVATGILGDELPSDDRVYLPSALFFLVIVVLIIRPDGLFARSSGAERL
jgi:branched-chain amino acid transport system permease protein